MKLRTRLIVAFVVATLVPLALTVAVSISLLQRSVSTKDVDELSVSLEKTGRELYVRACEALRQDAVLGRATPMRLDRADLIRWPKAAQEFDDSGEDSRFTLAAGDRLEYMVRHGDGVWVYSTSLHGVELRRVAEQYARARAGLSRDWRRGYVYTLLVLAAAVWVLALAAVVLWTRRLSRPIQQLTRGLSEVAAGRLDHRVPGGGFDEIGAAVEAFNSMADQLRHSRDRLVYMARLESWQALARKMAHEVKNSLTPIRLTVEEIAARNSERRDDFLAQASQIVVDEVTALERRVRAFADFSSEPPIRPREIDVNSLLEERISFLKSSHPNVSYGVRLEDGRLLAVADEDLVKGMLTNLLENAAQAVEPGGAVLGITTAVNGTVAVEVH